MRIPRADYTFQMGQTSRAIGIRGKKYEYDGDNEIWNGNRLAELQASCTIKQDDERYKAPVVLNSHRESQVRRLCTAVALCVLAELGVAEA